MYISEVENFRMKSPLKEEVDEKGREVKVIEKDSEIRYNWINRRIC